MNHVIAYLVSLKNPLKLLQLLMIIGGLWIAYLVLASTQGAPKPWETEGPAYRVGEMQDFTRTFPAKPLPALRLQSEDGEVPLTRYADGTPLVVNLWATWCAPCVEELPSLAALQDELGEEVRVLAVAMEGGNGTKQRAMLDRLGAGQLELLWDPTLSLARSYSDDMRLPITVIYDGRGREIGRLEGSADWSAAESVRLVRTIARGGVPG